MPSTWQQIRDDEVNHGVSTFPVHNHKPVPSHEGPTNSEIATMVTSQAEEDFPEPDFCVTNPSHDI